MGHPGEIKMNKQINKFLHQNSIRHNLSLHKIFVREAPTGHGQPAYWKLRPGTVVRLPERKIIVHDEMAAYHQAGMQECFMPEGPVDMSLMRNHQMPGECYFQILISPRYIRGGSRNFWPGGGGGGGGH